MKKMIPIMFLCLMLLFLLAGCSKDAVTNDDTGHLFTKNHTVTLVMEGMSDKKITIEDGKTLAVDFTPQKDNFFFAGWYTDNACTIPYDFARPVTTSFNLYARFVLRSKTITCRDVKIKALANAYDNNESVVLSLIGFDYDYLEKNGMGLQFNIVYDVRYTKDYHVPFDIGYAGAPQYKLSLINSSLQGYSEEKISAAGMWQGRTLSYNTPLMFSQGNQVELLFSTDNVQNILSFSNIVVTIEAIKLR